MNPAITQYICNFCGKDDASRVYSKRENPQVHICESCLLEIVAFRNLMVESHPSTTVSRTGDHPYLGGSIQEIGGKNS